MTRVQSHSACSAWMFLTVPPLGASPLHAPFADTIGPLVDTWNEKLKDMTVELGNDWNDTWVGVFDTGNVFTVRPRAGRLCGQKRN